MLFNQLSTGGIPEGVYQNIQIFTENGTFTIPKSGKYRVTVIGKGGNEDNSTSSTGVKSGCGGGCAESDLALTAGGTIAVTASGNASFGSYLSTTAATDSTSTYPSSGSGTGGNVGNYTGESYHTTATYDPIVGGGNIGGSKWKSTTWNLFNENGLFAYGKGGKGGSRTLLGSDASQSARIGNTAAVIIQWN